MIINRRPGYSHLPVIDTGENTFSEWARLERIAGRIADLRGADLRGADLRGADLVDDERQRVALARTLIVPQTGAYEGYKKLWGGSIAHLRIPAKAKRCNASGRKCRASEAEVLAIWDSDGNPIQTSCSSWDSSFVYEVGKVVKPSHWEEDRWKECAGGIRHFITREEAEAY